jgi:hypothetical protein
VKRIPFALAAVALLCAFGPEWREFKNVKGNFSVMMPGTPKEQNQTEQTAAGPMNLYMASVMKEPNAYFVSYSDMPKATWKGDVKKMLAGARDGAATRVKGTIVADRELLLDGKYPGREFKVFVGGQMEMTQRVYLVKHRLYQLNMGCMLGKCTPAQVQEYMESFKLLGPAK